MDYNYLKEHTVGIWYRCHHDVTLVTIIPPVPPIHPRPSIRTESLREWFALRGYTLYERVTNSAKPDVNFTAPKMEYWGNDGLPWPFLDREAAMSNLYTLDNGRALCFENPYTVRASY